MRLKFSLVLWRTFWTYWIFMAFIIDLSINNLLLIVASSIILRFLLQYKQRVKVPFKFDSNWSLGLSWIRVSSDSWRGSYQPVIPKGWSATRDSLNLQQMVAKVLKSQLANPMADNVKSQPTNQMASCFRSKLANDIRAPTASSRYGGLWNS